MSRLFVGHLPYDARERDLERVFREYGDIREVIVKKGYGFVEFYDNRDAEDAMRSNGIEILGSRITVEYTRPRRERDDRRDDRRRDYRDDRDDRRDDRRDRDYRRRDRSRSRSRGRRDDYDRPARRFERPRSTKFRVQIEGLSDGVNWQDIKDFFRSAGEVTYADVDRNDRTRGVADFATYEDLQSAIKKLDGEELRGSRIRLSEDRDRIEGDSRYPDRAEASPVRRDRSASRTRRERSASRSRSVSQSRGRSASPPR